MVLLEHTVKRQRKLGIWSGGKTWNLDSIWSPQKKLLDFEGLIMMDSRLYHPIRGWVRGYGGKQISATR